MTIAYWCVLGMIIFPYIFAFLTKTGPNYNNNDPRAYLEKLSGWRRRAYNIELNSFEITPAFGLAVIIAHLAHAPQLTLDKLAIAFVITRIIYALCYIFDKASLRTLFWTLGIGCIIGLFYISAAVTQA
ncbi:MAPEG family protein [soil metagenome]